ncbi:hypothetical protein QZH41_008170 [Actinostola sp. cb2023]|nr:hypothetical protein QZH41_008170 [Actinostola sp. cb2023]
MRNEQQEQEHQPVTSVDTLEEAVSNGQNGGRVSPVREHSPMRTRFQCETCRKTFARKDILKRHRKIHDKAPVHKCNICGKKFNRLDYLKKHKKVHEKRAVEREFKCNTCGEVFRNAASLKAHINSVHPLPPPPAPSTTTEETRKRPQNNHQEETAPKKSKSTSNIQEVSAGATTSWESDPLMMPPVVYIPNDEPSVRNVVREHWRGIRTRQSRRNRIQDWYNFRLESYERHVFQQFLDQILADQSTVFKLNLSFGFVLRNTETGNLQYHHASVNNHRVFEQLFLIGNVRDIEQVVNAIHDLDITEWVKQQRPNSKWIVDVVTNVCFYVSKIRGHPIGRSVLLPPFILNNRGVCALDCSDKSGQPYRDQLCFFRCLALHNGCHLKNLERDTKHYFERYLERFPQEAGIFQGIKLEELSELEKQYEINIAVYSLEPDNSDENEAEDLDRPEIIAHLVQRSHRHFTTTLNLNLYKHHFSYIKSLPRYSKSYRCSRCDKYWKHVGMLHRHERTCEAKVRYRFPGSTYKTPKTIFDLLEDEGIAIPESYRYFPYRATFDFECMLNREECPNDTKKLSWVAKHIPLSASVCSNVPSYYKPQCFVTDGDSKDLVKHMIDYLVQISQESYNLLKEQFAEVFTAIDEKIGGNNEPEATEERVENDDDRGIDVLESGDEIEEEIEEENEEDRAFIDDDCSEQQDPCFYQALNQELGERTIQTECELNPEHQEKKREHPLVRLKVKLEEYLKELPVLGFNTGRFTYAKFLKAYDCPQTKGFFPYEWMDSLEKLNYPTLPPHLAFYSSLTNTNITAEEYAYCQQVWEENNMVTFRDFLVWYNNLDVQPFCDALEKMCAFWKEKHIDMLRQGISIPGITLTYLFMTLEPDIFFSLFDEKNKDLYHLFKKNMVGGPSIIFHRYHEAGKTKIREVEMKAQGKEAKDCQKIVGFDANALYLGAVMQDMPTGPFTRRIFIFIFIFILYITRREETGFKKKMATEWLEREAEQRKITIRHQVNDTEKRIGERRLPVDGFHGPSQTVFQFHGCYWHGHDCTLNQGKEMNETRKKPLSELRTETEANTEYIQDHGYEVVEVWECEWRRIKKTNPSVKQFLNSKFQRPLDTKWTMTEQEILQAIRDQQLFGVVECDIRVPEHLKPKFSEMCPIFKNVEISREDIGQYMKDFAEEYNIMPRPRRSLIGSFFAENILLATPLIKWYLDHGLEVTKIYQVVEYTPKPCFKAFGDAVSDARRAGDVDPNKAIIADTMKLAISGHIGPYRAISGLIGPYRTFSSGLNRDTYKDHFKDNKDKLRTLRTL